MSTEPPRSERPDYDQALKPIISRAPAGFLGVIAPGIQWRGELSPELPAVTRQADLVWEVDFTDATHGILHVELQTQPDMQMGERMADYCTRLWMREHQPIYSVVVFLRPATTLPQSPFVIRCMGQERLRFTFDVVRIWELAPTLVLDTPYYDLWPLAGLMQDVTLDSTVAVASQIASSPVTRHEQSELIGLLALLSGMRLPRQVLMEALRRQHMI